MSVRNFFGVLLAIVPIAAAHADGGVHVAFVAGVGLAQGILGGHIEVRKGQLAVFAGSGAIAICTLGPGALGGGDCYGAAGYGGVLGVRWFSGDAGDRLFLSGMYAFSTQQDPGDSSEGFPPEWHHTNAPAFSSGWRFRFGPGRAPIVLDLGAGFFNVR